MSADETPDNTDLPPLDRNRKKYQQVVEDPGGQMCRLGDELYPEGSVQIVDGRPATCRGGRWLGDGDDPPVQPKRLPSGLIPGSD